jgi:histone H2B
MLAAISRAVRKEQKMTEKEIVASPVIEDAREKASTSIESIEKAPTTRKEKRTRKHARVVPYGTKPRKWNHYLFRVLKDIHPDTSITKKSMAVMSDFIDDTFEKIMNEAAELARKHQRHTLTTREIQGAVRLVLPGELATHAVSEGHKAYVKYCENTKINKEP